MQPPSHFTQAPDGTRLAWRLYDAPESSGDSPPVVLTNGIGTTENFWRDLLEALRPSRRVVTWDYRGHGESDLGGGDGYGLTTHAADLAAVLDAVHRELGPSTPAPDHIGFSMGVPVLLELYRSAPSRLRSLTLIAGSARAPWEGLLTSRAFERSRALVDALTLTGPSLAPLLRWGLRSPLALPLARLLGILRGRARAEEVHTLLDAMARIDLTAYGSIVRALWRTRVEEVLPAISVPTLVIAAAHDVLIPPEQLRALHRRIRGARWYEVADAGHAALIEAGPEIARVVRDFLTGLGVD